ncbi:MAG TPA: branched-chain amino acid ABC transporter permease [Longimicrobiaceae bacterium]|nr:branched-chain amino acid ABC transporter permease [Longimicrobiaceae bacterium]
MGRLAERGWLVLALGAALAFPLLVDNAYFLSVVVSAFILAIAVYGLNVLVGYTGQLSLAHAGFFGIGAYAAGILTTTYGLSFWVALPAAVALAAVLGFGVGMVALRTRGDYFAIFTLAVGVMITLVIDHWEGVTGGTDGMIGVPPPTPLGPLAFDSLFAQYYLYLAFLLLTIAAVRNLARSLVGRTFMAIRNDEQLAQAIGINVGRAMRLSFTISASFAGLAGALYAPFLGYLGPSVSGLAMTFNMLLYLLIGGVASLAGPLVGTLLLITLTQGLLALEEYQFVVLGPLLVLSVIFFPQGLVGLARSSVTRPDPAHRDPAHAAPHAEPGH